MIKEGLDIKIHFQKYTRVNIQIQKIYNICNIKKNQTICIQSSKNGLTLLHVITVLLGLFKELLHSAVFGFLIAVKATRKSLKFTTELNIIQQNIKKNINFKYVHFYTAKTIIY